MRAKGSLRCRRWWNERLNTLTIAAARDALRKGEMTAVDLTMACLTAIDAGDGLNAFVHKTPEIALEQARAADARLQGGRCAAMCGIPLGIKDLFCTKGVPSQAASNILKGFRPEYESTVTSQLFDAGAVMLGKLNMDEFAMGSSNETSGYGNVVNPWRRGNDDTRADPRRVVGRVGGGGGGRPVPGRDRHRYRRVDPPARGLYRHRRDQADLWPGQPLGDRGLCLFAGSGRTDDQDVRDAAIMLRAMAGHDPKDSTSADLPVPDFEAALTGDIRGKTIGIPKEYRMDGMPDEIEALWADGMAMMRDAGAEIVDISLPHTKYALPAYYVIAPCRGVVEPRPL